MTKHNAKPGARPWTEGDLVCEALMGGIWIVRPKQNPNPKNPNALIKSVGSFYSEADARLFAASPAMYEALHQSLIITLGQYEAATEMGGSEELLRILFDSIRKSTDALRAANPASFTTAESEGE